MRYIWVMEKEFIELWAFYYNPMTYESASYVVSYHKTEKGAVLAMNEHKLEAKKEFKNSVYGKMNPKRFGAFESWYVKQFDLEIKP